jgi:hypothetical protein
MNTHQNFVEHLLTLPEGEWENSVEPKMEAACAAIMDSDEFNNAAGSTSATDWGIEEYGIEDIEVTDDECVVKVNYTASGEADEDSCFAGNGITGTAEVIIDVNGRVTVREVAAEVHDRHAYDDEIAPDYI